MKELTIISGKGGTGKTSVTASFATLAEKRVVVDADVDAANLFLTLSHEVLKKEEFIGGKKATIMEKECTQCGDCLERCRFDAISPDFVVDPLSCEGCGVCYYFCPAQAISFDSQVCGERFISTTKNGPMIHARLGIGEENSGMLVSVLRQEAREQAKDAGIPLIITDGPPGIGCPVIASVTNADALLLVAEPSVSGIHDIKRVKGLADQMNIPVALCINKADLNPEKTREIQNYAWDNNIRFTGKIPFDRDVTRAMNAQQSLVEFSQGPAAKAVTQVWEKTYQFINQTQDRLK